MLLDLISKFNQSFLNLKIEYSSLIQAHLKKKTSTINDAFQVHFCKLSYHFLDNTPVVRVLFASKETNRSKHPREI